MPEGLWCLCILGVLTTGSAQRLSEHLEDFQQKAEDLQQRAEEAEERLLATPASQMHREVNPLFSGSQDSPGDCQREASELEEVLQHRAELEALLGTQQRELQVGPLSRCLDEIEAAL